LKILKRRNFETAGLSSVPFSQKEMIMKIRQLALIALLTAAAIPASAETVSNAITANAITANAITSNAITSNAITSNAITSNAITSNTNSSNMNVGSAEGVETGAGRVDDVVGVELPNGKTITK
jgi:beta-mannanase